MAKVALSTMWAQGRFQRLGEFAAAARKLGFDHVEINYTVPQEGVEEILKAGLVAVSSLHAPTPRAKAQDGRWSEALNLAATDEEERRLAVHFARQTIDWAARAGAPLVVLHLGGIGNDMFPAERELRRLYDAGVRQGPQVTALRQECRRLRAEGAPAHLAAARKSLAELAEQAAARGIGLGLENRYHYHEIPSVQEALDLLSGYPPHLVGYWHDVGHAEVLHRLGLADKERWLNELKGRCLGSHIHDVLGLGDHRPPGRGDVDWRYIARGLPKDAPRVLEINQHMPEEQVAAAVPFLRQTGILP